MNKLALFQDRADAGRFLATKLAKIIRFRTATLPELVDGVVLE